MNRYSQKQISNNKVSAHSSLKKTTSLSVKANLPEAKLLLMILRRICYVKIAHAFTKIKQKNKVNYRALEVISRIVEERKKVVFTQIRIQLAFSTTVGLKKQMKRANISIFLPTLIRKLYDKATSSSFETLRVSGQKRMKNMEQLLKCLTFNLSNQQNQNKRISFRKIKVLNERQKLKSVAVKSLNGSIDKIRTKNLRIGFQVLVIVLSQNIYEESFINSQKKRKELYEQQNEKNKFLASERQQLLKLKTAIDNHTYERNNKIGQLKREKAIKVTQATANIRRLQNKMAQLKQSTQKEQRQLKMVQQVMHKRNNHMKDSSKAVEKVHGMFNEIKYEDDPGQQIRSSKSIVLNKQKFRSIMKLEFDDFCKKNEDFQIYQNKKQKNLICLYEGVDVSSIKYTQDYIHSEEENFMLKQFMQSLISYHLLKGMGDVQLKEDCQKLEQLFESMFMKLDEEENDLSTEMKGSFISYKSSKSMKKSSIRTSIMSLKSVK